jgi:predicted SAM-dependent methyltransferase
MNDTLLKIIAKKVVPRAGRQWGMQALAVMRTRLIAPTLIRSTSDIKLEIGSGPIKGQNGWLTMDLSYQSDLCWDLRNALPFPDNSIAVIYSSHVLEHFYYRELRRVLADCWRVLKPGGIFNTCVPDAGSFIRGYLNPDSFDRERFVYRPAVISDQRMDIVNYIAYMDGHHRYMFDRENLIHVLSSSGFVSVRMREFDPTLDRPGRKTESIYAIGVKP